MTISFLLASVIALLQPKSPVAWSFSGQAQEDGRVRVSCVAQLEEGWHVYATVLPSDQGPIATSFRFEPSTAFTVVGAVSEPEAKEEYDPNFGMVVRYHGGAPAFEFLLQPTVQGPFTVKGEVEYMVCNDKTCLPPVAVAFAVEVPQQVQKH